jgi:hypothetical protein
MSRLKEVLMSSIKSLGMLELLERMLMNVGRAGHPAMFFSPFMPPILLPPSQPTSDVTR